MANPHRQEKLGELIAMELSDLIRTRLKDPRVGFASITHVEVSGDLRHAKVFISVMGSEEEQAELVFKLDTSIAEGARGLELIRQNEQVRQ